MTRMVAHGLSAALFAAFLLYALATSLAGFIPHGPLWLPFVWAVCFVVGIVAGLEAR